MSIPTKAIEAAARAHLLNVAGINWESATEAVRYIYRTEVDAALTAAAPHIQAAELRDAAEVLDDRAEKSRVVSQNRAAHDFDTRNRYAAYAEEARCIAHVLRARADQLEGETE